MKEEKMVTRIETQRRTTTDRQTDRRTDMVGVKTRAECRENSCENVSAVAWRQTQ